MPCKQFKICQSELIPVFQKLINASFDSGYFPDCLKLAIVTPILKSVKLDREIISNYRPISTLTIISKIFEKCILKQIVEHLNINNLYCKYQSAYRSGHSCETALTKIYDDILEYLSPTTYVTLVFLDFSAAFDTIDHAILVERLKHNYGIRDKALDLLSSYLKNRNYRVKINNSLSDITKLNFGVPQGSILGPVIFSLYISHIRTIAENYNINIHFYADDIQLYMQCNEDTNFHHLTNCLEKIQSWTNNNFLKLNNDKTKILTVSTNSYKLFKIKELKIMGKLIQVQDSVKNLGFVIDNNLNMVKQINHICSQGYGMLKNLWKISKKVTDINVRTQLIHSGILSRTDYCNALYTFLPNTQLKKLQKLINSAVRFIFNIKGIDRRNHITPYLRELHFLPVHYRVKFKICLMVYKCINNQSPCYLQNLIHLRIPCWHRTLRIDHDKLLLAYKAPYKQEYKNRGFSIASSRFWNTLPFHIRNSPSTTAFKVQLKTFYFREWTESNL